MEKLKILMIAPFYNIYIKEFTETLAKYVDRITVFVHYNPLTEISRYLPKRGYIRYLYRYTKDNLIDRTRTPDNVNIEIVSLPYFIPDGKNPFLGDKIYTRVDKIIQKRNIEFDIIHSHSTWISGYVGARIREKYKKPLVITLHHDMKLEHNMKITNKILWAWSIADRIISVNKNDLRKLPYSLQKKGIYIPNGFNVSNIYPIERKKNRKALGIQDNKKVLFSLGYLIERKGFNYLINAMKYVTKERGDVICVIAGDGPMRNLLNRQIIHLNLKGYVKLIGHISESTKNSWLNASDLFVFPSLEEAFGIPVLEALAVGTPVVATINGGSEEIITSEEYGLLAKPADPRDLAEKILIALERNWDKEKIRKYAEQFTWNNIAKQTLGVYKSIIV